MLILYHHVALLQVPWCFSIYSYLTFILHYVAVMNILSERQRREVANPVFY